MYILFFFTFTSNAATVPGDYNIKCLIICTVLFIENAYCLLTYLSVLFLENTYCPLMIMICTESCSVSTANIQLRGEVIVTVAVFLFVYFFYFYGPVIIEIMPSQSVNPAGTVSGQT